MAKLFLNAWALRFGLTPAQARKLRRLGKEVTLLGVKECNGDPYLGINPEDKDACSTAWGKDLETARRTFETAAKEMGFDAVDFGTGLIPVLAKGHDSTIIVPGTNDDGE